MGLQSRQNNSTQTVPNQTTTEDLAENHTFWCSTVSQQVPERPKLREEVSNYFEDCHHCVRITALKQMAACNPRFTHPWKGTEGFQKTIRTEITKHGQRMTDMDKSSV